VNNRDIVLVKAKLNLALTPFNEEEVIKVLNQLVDLINKRNLNKQFIIEISEVIINNSECDDFIKIINDFIQENKCPNYFKILKLYIYSGINNYSKALELLTDILENEDDINLLKDLKIFKLSLLLKVEDDFENKREEIIQLLTEINGGVVA